MDVGDMAREMGRRGGRARARRLSPERRRQIASLGGQARQRSLLAARRLVDMQEPAALLDAVGSVVEALGPLVDVLYDRGFELASRVSAEGEVTATIGNRRVAAARRATTLKVRSKAWRVASEADLLRLKRLARANRASPGGTEDIAFLEARRTKGRK